MSDTSVIAILASVGIILAGSVTADASALASAVRQGEPAALEQFVNAYPESPYAPDALWLAAEVSFDKAGDSAQSPNNPKLYCSLNIARQPDGKALVTWDISGAKTATLQPLGFKKGATIPAKGSKVISYDMYVRVGLTATDAAGNKIQCVVVLNSNDFEVHGTTGFAAPPTYTA